jgi:hypothetical protein
VSGWTVQLSLNDEIIDTQTTGDDGCYTWANLNPLTPPNFYDVHEVVPDDWYAWTPTEFVCDPIASGGSCSYTFVNSQKVDVEACKLEDIDTNPATSDDRVPLSGWTVQLTLNGAVIDEQLTGENGCYTWENLEPLAPPDYYDIHEVVPDDWYAWTPTEFSCDPIASGGSCSYTFVNSQKVDVEACKLEDVDADPNTSGDRVPVVDWTVQLTLNGAVIDEQLTGENGCYTWENLEPLAPPDYYDIHEVVPDDWYAWTPTEFACDPIPSGGSCSYTFVNSQAVEVTACKVEDSDGNPDTLSDQSPVVDWPVSLTLDNVVIDEKLTGENGCYTWSNLQPGQTYDVHEEMQTGWYALGGVDHVFDPAASGDSLSHTFVNSRYVDVTACKVEDSDGDSGTTGDQTPVVGWSVSLTEDGTIVDTELTGTNGCYTWTDLLPGVTYDVHEEMQTGWFALGEVDHVFDPAASGDSLSHTFVNSRYAEKSGYKWHDLNADGKWDTPDEPALPDWTIELVDSGGDVVSTTTDENGYYEFTTKPGTYTVREVCPTDWFQSFPEPIDGCGSGVHDVTLVSGQSDTDNNFGNYRSAKKFGYKWHDLNANGSWDAGELGLANWTIELVDSAGQMVSTTTDSNGYYEFMADPGTYTVREVCPTNWLQSFPEPVDGCGSGIYADEVFVSATTYGPNNFGNYQYATKSGYKWNDLNMDGVPEIGPEMYIPDWRIILLNENGDVVASTSTDASGNYSFSQILPGTDYLVCEELKTGWFQTHPNKSAVCPSGYAPFGYSINLSSGEEDRGNNFGNYIPAGCTYTQGYWKTHSKYGPAPYDDGWERLEPDGEDTIFFLNRQSWYEVFWTAPAGNAYYILAHQYMAAVLNVLNGASPIGIVPTLADAEGLFNTYTPDQVAGNPSLHGEFVDLAEILDDYNNGLIGPGHCDSVESVNDIDPTLGQNCTLPEGYWISPFNSAWSSLTDVDGDGVSEGPKETLFDSGQEWLETLQTTELGWPALARKWMSTMLNVAKGADPTSVATELAEGGDILGGSAESQEIPLELQLRAAEIKLALESFNSGGTGPGMCTYLPVGSNGGFGYSRRICTADSLYWAEFSEDPGWLEIGDVDFDGELTGSAEKFLGGVTWHEAITANARGGNAFTPMAKQWITAFLNIVNGAAAPSEVMQSLTDAIPLLTKYQSSLSIPKKSSDRHQALVIAGTLEAFNTGILGPGACRY